MMGGSTLPKRKTSACLPEVRPQFTLDDGRQRAALRAHQDATQGLPDGLASAATDWWASSNRHRRRPQPLYTPNCETPP